MNKQKSRPAGSQLLVPALALLIFSCSRESVDHSGGLEVVDPRLEVHVVATEPDIVTPIGIAIDELDDLYVLESHTHTPESDYSGAKFDKIKKAVPDDQTHQINGWLTYADSIEDGMNIASYGQSIYLVTKNKVLVFTDKDGDGMSDERRPLVVMNPPRQVYDHAGLLGIEISVDGWIYISRGNIGGQRYLITGSDGSSLANFGDGGNVFRCRLDGSELEEVSTGFWNPFGLEISKNGGLWLTDNDPDSRGPNRLIELVKGGNFGYQSLYGGSGIHPFSAWNGELPGTLPYYAGIGEAPCAAIDASYTNLPPQYEDHLLVAIWEENKIVFVPLNQTFDKKMNAPTLIQGDSTFHPVAFASNSHGDIYFTDWVVRQYPNHGQGKIWKVDVRDDKRVLKSKPTPIAPDIWHNTEPDVSNETLIRLLEEGSDQKKAIARSILCHSNRGELLAALVNSDNSRLRLQALLASFQAQEPLPATTLAELLRDSELDICKMTMIYIAKNSRQDLGEEIMLNLTRRDHDTESFAILLETVRHLKSGFVKALQEANSRHEDGLTQQLDDDFIFDIIANHHLSDPIRVLALHHLKNPSEYLVDLISLMKKEKDELRGAIIESLSQINHASVSEILTEIIRDGREHESLKTQALYALSSQPGDYCTVIADLLENASDDLAEAIVRYLCACREQPDISTHVTNFITSYQGMNQNISDIWSLCKGAADTRPQTDQDWLDLLDQPGDAVKGKTIFSIPQNQCYSCHIVDGHGGNFGPDLSHIGSSKSERQLAQAILNPSTEIAPEWQGWIVTDSSGIPHLGWQIDVGRHDVELMNNEGEFITYASPQKYGPSEASLMPEYLENNLTTQDFRDLIAYLVSLK